MYAEWEKLKSGAEAAFQRKQFAESEQLWQLALEESARTESPLRGCICLDGIAACLFEQKRFADAEASCLTSLEIRSELLGEETLEVAYNLRKLSFILCAQEKFAEAESPLTIALSILLKVPNTSADEIRWTVHTLSTLYERAGRRFDRSAQFAFQNPESLPSAPPGKAVSICPQCKNTVDGIDCRTCLRADIAKYVSDDSDKRVFTTVVFARKDIRPGSVINLDAVEVHKRRVPGDLFLSEIEQALGMVATRLISEGEMLKKTDVESQPDRSFKSLFITGEHNSLPELRATDAFRPGRKSW